MNAEIIGTYDVIVREDKNIEEILGYAKFDVPELPSISFSSDRFPHIEGGKATIKRISLFSFMSKPSFVDVVSEINKQGCRLASPWDLVCLTYEKKDLQKELNLVSLGEIHSVVCGFVRGRHISIYSTQKIIKNSRDYVFLGVKSIN